MQICSLGFVFDTTLEQVLLIHKQRPTWQAGKVNGIGGKAEADETPLACMVRECQEETTLHIPESDWRHFGVINEQSAKIELYASIHQGPLKDTKQNDHEAVEWFPYQQLPENVISNLHFLVPMAREILRGHNSVSIQLNY